MRTDYVCLQSLKPTAQPGLLGVAAALHIRCSLNPEQTASPEAFCSALSRCYTGLILFHDTTSSTEMSVGHFPLQQNRAGAHCILAAIVMIQTNYKAKTQPLYITESWFFFCWWNLHRKLPLWKKMEIKELCSQGRSLAILSSHDIIYQWRTEY